MIYLPLCITWAYRPLIEPVNERVPLFALQGKQVFLFLLSVPIVEGTELVRVGWGSNKQGHTGTPCKVYSREPTHVSLLSAAQYTTHMYVGFSHHWGGGLATTKQATCTV